MTMPLLRYKLQPMSVIPRRMPMFDLDPSWPMRSYWGAPDTIESAIWGAMLTPEVYGLSLYNATGTKKCRKRHHVADIKLPQSEIKRWNSAVDAYHDSWESSVEEHAAYMKGVQAGTGYIAGEDLTEAELSAITNAEAYMEFCEDRIYNNYILPTILRYEGHNI